MDNKVDWQGPNESPSEIVISTLYWPGYIPPAYKDLRCHANKKLNEGQSPCVSGSREKPRVAGEACGETVSFNQRARVQDPGLTSICPAQVFMSKILNQYRFPGCHSVVDLAL